MIRIRVPILTLVVLALLSGCKGEKSAGDGGGTVIVSMGTDASSLFPLLVAEETGKAITDLLFDHLADIGDDMSTVGDAGFEPRLAKSWDWAKDSLSIAFHLDPAARFHDGARVTAGDVRYSFRLASDTALGSQITPLITNIDSVSVTDSSTAVFWFRQRSPEQFYDIAYQIPVVPEHVYGKMRPSQLGTSDLVRQPVGSGRFRLGKWEPGVRVELLADTANYHRRPGVDRVVFLLAQAPAAAATALLAGESDFYPTFPIDQVPSLDSNRNARAVTYRMNGYGFLAFNANDRKSKTRPHPLLGDVAVRRAISMALDRRAMLSNVFNSSAVPAWGPFPAGIQTADSTLRVPAFDTSAAAAALDSAGWKRGADGMRMKAGRPLKLEILVPTSSAPRMRYADLIQEQLHRAGIEVELARVTPPQFGPRLGTGDFDAVLMTVNTDPSVTGAKQFWSSNGVTSGSNYWGYRSPVADALLDSAVAAHDVAGVRQYAARAYQQIIDDAPAVWLYTSTYTAAVNRRIETRPLRSDGWWTHFADWTIPADKRIDRDRIGLRPKTP